MSLVVTLAKVKERSAITGTSYDSRITNLINDWVPALEFAISENFIADTGNTGLQATLNLGAVEVISGEVLALLAREPGGSETLSFGWLEVRPVIRNLTDPFGLKEQGAGRLQPYLKHRDLLQGSIGVLTGGSRGGDQ